MGKINWSVFVTSSAVMNYGTTPEERKRFVQDMKDFGASKVFLEVWRGRLFSSVDVLRTLRDDFRAAGVETATGLMPVRGRDIALEGTEHWDNDTTIGGNSRWGADINYLKPIARDELRRAMERGAEIFDEFIIDDALCTQDTSALARKEKGDRSWGQFRRDLITEVCREVLVGPARKKNPGIKMILKFPQWYDRLAVFGYDTSRQPAVFDATWIGTETRDPKTLDFGYVPQYEAFFNVCWHMDAEPNLEGAWFDYIECDPTLFVEQAYQSILGGVRNLTIFGYTDTLFRENNYLLAALKTAMPRLETLAERLEGQEHDGVVTVRPHNPDPQADGYLFDGLGMIGVPLVPRASWPEVTPKALLLTDHVAHDPELTRKVAEAVAAGGTVFLTASLLAQNDDNEDLKKLAGFHEDGWSQPNRWSANRFTVGGKEIRAEEPVDFRFDLRPQTAQVLAAVGGVAHHRTEWIPVVTRQEHPSGGAVVVLNVSGIAPHDYHMSENLNVPIPLVVQDYPVEIVNVIQELVAKAIGRAFVLPPRVAYYPFSSGDFVLENFTDETVIAHPLGDALPAEAKELIGIATITDRDGVRSVQLPPRTVALVGA